MSRSARIALFLIAWLVLAPAIAALATRMPDFGAHPLPYGDLINRVAPLERHVSNTVSAVNFDYRGFDTLGEEFMLVCAVTGVVVVLRGNRGEQLAALPAVVEHRQIIPRSDAIVLLTRLAAPLIVLFGMYVGLHAMTTPGGGFQGGVIVASGLLLVYLGQSYATWRKVVLSSWFDAFEGSGAALYAASGLSSMLLGHAFLTNTLPLGTFRDVFSGGLMLVENLGVLLAVAGGFTVLFNELLEETRTVFPKET